MPELSIKQKTWNLKLLYKSDSDPEMDKDLKRVGQESYVFINKWKSRDDWLNDPKILKIAMDEYEKLMRFFGTDGKVGLYYHLRSSQNQEDPKIKAKSNKLNDFANKIQNDIQFFELRITRIKPELQKTFLEHEELAQYKHYLERSFANAKYLLSEPEEKILNLKSQTSYVNWVKMTSEFLSKEERDIVTEEGKPARKTFSEIMSLMENKSQKIRDSAAIAYNDILNKNIDVSESEINSILQDKKTDDDLRNLPRPDKGRHINDDIDTELVDKLIERVSSRYDISKNYYKLKAKLLGLKKLKYHERNVEYGEINKKYPYEEAVEIVYNVFKRLDAEFAGIFKNFVENGQFDVYPKKGKATGAFCISTLISHPVFILLNHDNSLNDVLTIAHESGHGINSELMKKKQNSINFGTPLSTAEVASTFMEDFVLEEILKSAGDELRLSIMMMKLNSDISSIFRQTACYKFEQDLHKEFREKGYLSKAEIGLLFKKHMSAYMGDYVEQSLGSENWWVPWNHIRYFFYVYSYSSGLLISKSLQNSVKKDPSYIMNVKEFLSSGMSDSPKDIFSRLGINIADSRFWDNGLKEIDSLLKETELLAKKLKKI